MHGPESHTRRRCATAGDPQSATMTLHPSMHTQSSHTHLDARRTCARAAHPTSLFLAPPPPPGSKLPPQ